jgi:hypothetical protein
MKRFLAFLPALFVAVLMVGCTADLAPGFVGQIKNRSGFSGTILQPGRVTCWGYDQLWKVETRDQLFNTPLNVLLEKDQVNFGVTVSVTATLKNDDASIAPLFNKVKPNEFNEIGLDQVYAVYAKRIMNSIPRQLIRPLTVESILGGVEALENEIETAVVAELKDTPIQIVGLSLTNLDFPKFITDAQNQAKEREIQIKTAEAQAKVEIARLEGVKKQALIEKDIAMIEAQKIADANRLVGESLLGPTGERYLRWHEIKVYGAAANGPNNAFFLPLNLLSGGGGNPVGSTLLEKPFRDAIDTAIGNTSTR